MLQTFVEDARDAVRVLRATPLFTATAALSLAIGIGANTTIFPAANALLLRASPGHSEPPRVVDVGRTQGGVGFDTVSYPNYRDLRQRVTQLSGIYAYTMEPHAMSPGTAGDAKRVHSSAASGNYFAILGVIPRHGRVFRDDVTRRGVRRSR